MKSSEVNNVCNFESWKCNSLPYFVLTLNTFDVSHILLEINRPANLNLCALLKIFLPLKFEVIVI